VSTRRSRALVRCYPRAWRARYGAELEALLDEHGVDLRTTLDVLAGALDARLAGGAPADARMPLVGVLWAGAIFCAAGLGFQRMVEYEDFAHAAGRHPAVAAGLDAVVAGAVIAGLAALAAALVLAPALVRAIRCARGLAGPLASCLAGIAAMVLAGALLVAYARLAAPRPPHDARTVAAVSAWAVATASAGSLAVAGAGRALRRLELAPRELRRALRCAWAATAGIALAAAGLAIWGLALRAGAPHLFSLGDGGVLATPTPLSWLAALAATTVALTVALRALRRPTDGPTGSRVSGT
jgi:hypothetical protein